VFGDHDHRQDGHGPHVASQQTVGIGDQHRRVGRADVSVDPHDPRIVRTRLFVDPFQDRDPGAGVLDRDRIDRGIEIMSRDPAV